MLSKQKAGIVSLVLVMALCAVVRASIFPQDLTPKEQLGKLLFFDAKLSTPSGMSCATCHDPAAGFADPRKGFPTSQGIVPTRFGNRNAPQAAYAMGGPQELRRFNGGYAGGTFWDGRADNLFEQAKGPYLNPLEMKNPQKRLVVTNVQHGTYASLFRSVYGPGAFANPETAYNYIADAISEYEQSSEMNPFSSKLDAFRTGQIELTPMERTGMMLFHGKAHCSQCHNTGQMSGKCAGGCACGCAYTGICTCGDACTCGCPKKGATACDGGCKCGCAYTGVCTCGPDCQCGCLNSTASACAGGCTCGCAFRGYCTCGPDCQCGCPNEPQACVGGCTCGCAWTGICNCGPSCNCGCASGGMKDGKPLFTNHGYFNLGVPANPANPFYSLPRGFNPLGAAWVDYGLGAVLSARGVPDAWEEMGKFKVPSLRNCAITAPYMHNGVFSDLQTVVAYYNTRDVAGAPWGAPEVDHPNIFMSGNFGSLGLTPTEIDALVAFLETLNDGYVPSARRTKLEN